MTNYPEVEDVELNDSEETCECGKKIYCGEPCGILENGGSEFKICMHCTKERLTEGKYNTGELLRKLNRLYKKNIKNIIANRL